ncbi:MAG: carboxylating nicotinate-nucleotide diphosphorylase [Phycisphaerae bacterium]|nr:carboxylating nicotinate-nucleotide diphosphorylase [Phycisphaerae bacterium]
MTVCLTESERENIRHLVYLAREEDLGGGDITGRILPADLRATGRFIAREPMVLCGGVLLDTVAKEYNEMIEMILWQEEGAFLEAGDIIAEWTGPAWAVLAAERVALNFLQRLSGIATMTRKFVNAVEGTGAAIYDTRKTTPGWRQIEKYAVRVGGGKNHRRGLYDSVMVKDNHLHAMLAGGIPHPLREIGPDLEELRKEIEHDGFVEVEIDQLSQLPDALKLPVDIILLDNMMPDKLVKAVRMRDEAGLKGKVELEASGGISLRRVREVAETGVERISCGSITHSAPAADIALDIEVQKKVASEKRWND